MGHDGGTHFPWLVKCACEQASRGGVAAAPTGAVASTVTAPASDMASAIFLFIANASFEWVAFTKRPFRLDDDGSATLEGRFHSPLNFCSTAHEAQTVGTAAGGTSMGSPSRDGPPLS
jgi:hypothetical protein